MAAGIADHIWSTREIAEVGRVSFAQKVAEPFEPYRPRDWYCLATCLVVIGFVLALAVPTLMTNVAQRTARKRP